MCRFSAPAGKSAPGAGRRAGAAAFGLLLCTALSVAAAEPQMPVRSLEERFAAMDADGDGAVSREEFFAAHPGMKDEAFAAIDGDGDGVIMLREWKDFAAGHGRAGAMPPMPPMPGGAPRDGTGMPPADPGRPPALLMPPDAPR